MGSQLDGQFLATVLRCKAVARHKIQEMEKYVGQTLYTDFWLLWKLFLANELCIEETQLFRINLLLLIFDAFWPG